MEHQTGIWTVKKTAAIKLVSGLVLSIIGILVLNVEFDNSTANDRLAFLTKLAGGGLGLLGLALMGWGKLEK